MLFNLEDHKKLSLITDIELLEMRKFKNIDLHNCKLK